LDFLEVAEPTKTNLRASSGFEEYKQKYVTLQRNHQKLIVKYDIVKALLVRADTELSKLWDAFNKIVFK
jgi:hypothetical protein